MIKQNSGYVVELCGFTECSFEGLVTSHCVGPRVVLCVHLLRLQDILTLIDVFQVPQT